MPTRTPPRPRRPRVDLRTLREVKAWSQQQLATAAGIPSQTTISQLERGVISVKFDVAKRLAKALGVSLDTLEAALAASRERNNHEHAAS